MIAHDLGGGVRGMVASELLPALDRMPAFDLTPQLLAFVRESIAAILAMPPPLTPEQKTVGFEERRIPGTGDAPDVRVLIYTPAGEEAHPRPAYLHIHGGGYVMGVPEQNDGPNRSLAAALGCVVVSVDYRLAPETRFPGLLEDCYAALRWLHDEAGLGVDRTRIAIGGESAGGGLAAALAIYARDRGEVPICFQVLDSPMLDDRTGSTTDPHPYCGAFVWTPASNRFGWGALLGIEPGGDDTPAGASAARVADLSGLPPALITVGALDLFLEESLEYARRLTRAGAAVELHVTPGAFHGFNTAGGDAPQVQGCLRLRNEALARAFRET